MHFELSRLDKFELQENETRFCTLLHPKPFNAQIAFFSYFGKTKVKRENMLFEQKATSMKLLLDSFVVVSFQIEAVIIDAAKREVVRKVEMESPIQFMVPVSPLGAKPE